METYKVYFSVSKNTEYRMFLELINNSGFSIQTNISTTFSQKEAASADMVIVDEKTASRQCHVLSKIKKESLYFLTVLLLASKNTTPGKSLSDCIDDIVFRSFPETEWKRRMGTYLHIREKERKHFSFERNKFKTLFSESHSIMLLIDPETGNIVNANRAACDFYGYPHSELTQMKIQQINLLNDDQIKQKMKSAASGKVNPFTFEHRLADGSIKTVEVYSGKIYFNGKPFLHSIIHDITKTKKTEKLLREREESYRKIIENSPDIVVLMDKNGIVRFINHRIREYGNYAPEDIIDKPITNFIPPEDYQKARDAVMRVFNNNQAAPFFSSSLLLKDGKKIPVLTRGVLLKYNGELLNMTVIRDISFIKEAERKLKESEEKYHSIFKTSSDIIAITELASGKYFETNDSFKEILGYAKEDLLGKTSIELKIWGNNEDRNKMINALRKKGFIKNMETQLRAKDGHIITGLFSAQLIYLHGNGLIVSETHDITNIKQVEESLRESRQLFETLTSISPTGIFRADASGKTTYVNPKWSEITGVSFEKATTKGWADILPPNEKEKLLARWLNNMALQTFSKDKLRIVRPDGTVRWILGHAVPEIIDGKFTGYVGTITDITDFVQTERALRESENKYRSLAETSIDMILTFDMHRRIAYVNPAVKEILGYKPEEILGKEFRNFVSADSLGDALRYFKKGEKGEKISPYELELLHKNGKKISVEINPTSLYDMKGKIIGRLTFVRDITVRKKSEKELLLRDKALNAAANVIIITNSEGVIEWVNQAFTKFFGFTANEAIGKYAGDILRSGKQNDTFWENLNNTLQNGQVWKGEIIDKRKDGTLYTIEEIITPVTNKDGKAEHLIGIMTDITDRKKAEHELLVAKETAEESSRLKSAFLTNMNHEIRTPMNAIMGFSELILEGTPEEKDNYAKIVFNSSGQLLNLIDDVIFLSRLQSEKLPVKKTAFYPSEIVNEIFLMFDLPEMKRNLQLQTQLPENAETYVMQADTDKIKQVLTNFVSNALKYTKNGYVKLGFEIQNKNIVFFVEDSGMGIPENEQQHIFETFYRGNRAVSSAIRGTGLGLNIAKELVELMGGSIGVISKPGQGSRFYFNLPYESVKSPFKEEVSNKPATKKWEDMNILIAEDDETNFLYLDVLIRGKVHRIDRACNGREAVEMIRKNAYDMVLMDIKMPVMSGIEATRIIKSSFPDLPVIATTAYATLEEKEKAMESGCDDYLSKPIRKKDLLDTIFRFVSDKK